MEEAAVKVITSLNWTL